MESIWSERARNDRPAAAERQEQGQARQTPPGEAEPLPKKVEAAVIGGGMAGVLCAWLLQEAGIEAVVFEAETIGSGQTKNTTAKITSQHGLIYEKLSRTLGAEAARHYAAANQAAIDEYERVIREYEIACDFKRLPAYLYTGENEGVRKLELERAAAKKLGLPASLVYETELPVPVKAALKFEDQAQFSPLDFLHGLAGRLPVYEHVRVLKVRDHELLTDRGPVTAGSVVFATHFPFMNWPGLYFARMYQERSYVLAIEGPERLSGIYYGIDRDGLSVRSAGDVTLLGGMGYRTGENRPGDPFEALRSAAERFYPGYRERAIWAAQDCMTLDSVPYIGRFSGGRPDWYVATGFGKWGMTSSMVAAMAIRDSLTGRKNPDWQVFSPGRLHLRASAGSFLKNTALTAKNFLTPGGPRCPHLGCKLKWNPAERTWDCPCHGSRFSGEGALIDNPAQTGIGKEKAGAATQKTEAPGADSKEQ